MGPESTFWSRTASRGSRGGRYPLGHPSPNSIPPRPVTTLPVAFAYCKMNWMEGVARG